jgi:hypothetical protein
VTGAECGWREARLACRLRTLTAVGLICAGAWAMASCNSPGSADGVPTPPATPGVPLTSSVSSPSATWAALAMGNLHDPLNTFWQLVTLSGDGSHWTVTTPPGVASNGGLVVSPGKGGSAVAGFLPSQDLTVSPLAATTGGGATWSAGVLLSGLAPLPDALASPAGGPASALVRGAGGTVVASGGGLVSWHPLVTEHSLTSQPSASSCGVTKITAVGLGRFASVAGSGSAGSSGSAGAGSTALIGTTCARGLRPGLFVSSSGQWVQVGPTLPAGVGSPLQVIRLVGTSTGAAALVSTGSGSHASLYALWSADGLRTWTVSPGLDLSGRSLVSTGTTPSGGFVVSAAPVGGRGSAWVVEPSAGGWQSLAVTPAGTSSVVATPAGGYDALVVHASVLDAYTLTGGAWRYSQKLRVPIQYGSSS